jgi:hypothetical protein
MKYWGAMWSGILLAACAPQSSAPLASAQTEAQLRTLSCDSDTERYEASPVPLIVTDVKLGTASELASALPENVKFEGGWHLTSTNPEFGGLSGLAILDTGHLFAVSDKGYAVTIGLADDKPDGNAAMMPLHDAEGKILTGKAHGDAEGLAYRDGLAYVSFERNHRILAYDFGRCGVAAKGVAYAGLPKDKIGARIAANDGAEALDFGADGRVRAGYETVIDGRAPLVTFDSDGIARTEAEFVEVEDGFKLVGADAGYFLFRAYDRDIGNRNIVTGPNISFRLTPPLAVDNFEGIVVVSDRPDASLIYLISDDNFSGRQRTLLYMFEVGPPA